LGPIPNPQSPIPKKKKNVYNKLLSYICKLLILKK
jgi:hypothetical protein